MNSNIVSRKYGWFLARVIASFENFMNIVATSYNTIEQYNLQPGRNIKICNILKANSKIKALDKFILLPYFKEFIRNYWYLQIILKSIIKQGYQYLDEKYYKKINELINLFYQERENKRGFVFKELLEFDDHENSHLDIALPEFWLNENSVDLGETVLLRNDELYHIII